MVPALLILLVMLGYPIAYTLRISVSQLDLATFLPEEFVGLANYARVLSDPAWWHSVKVTVIYLALALPIQMFLGVAIAYLLNAVWIGGKVVRALFLIPMAIAPVVAGGIWKMLLEPLWGVINYALGLVGLGPYTWLADPTLAMVSVVIIDTWRWTPLIILIAAAGIATLPKSPLEAARVDGASWWQRLWHVELPMLMPVLMAAFIVRWLGAIKMFDIILASTQGGPGAATSVVNLYIYNKAFRSLEFGTSSAMAILTLLAALILTALFLRINRYLERRW